MDTSVERALGRVEGQLSHLIKGQEELSASFRALQDESRREYMRIDASIMKLEEGITTLSTKVGEVEPVVAGLRRDMEKVMPVAEQVVRWRTVGAGVFIALTLIGSLFSSVVVSAKDRIISFLFG